MIRFQWSCALRSGLPTEQRSDSLFCARCGYSIIFFQTCLTAARRALAASNARQQRVMTKNSIMERWIGSCRRELLDRTLIWNQRHLMMMLREYEDFCNSHRPHRALDQAAPLRPLPDGIIDLDHFRVRRHDRVGGVIHEYRLVA